MTREQGTLIAASMFQDLSEAQILGIAIWGGLAILTLALLILMRTRWGQARPVAKCVALSVFAHFLLFAYAYGTRLIMTVPVVEESAPFEVQFIDTVQPADEEPEQNDDTSAAPWDLSSGETPLETNVSRSDSIPTENVETERASVSLEPAIQPSQELASVDGVSRPDSTVQGAFRPSEFLASRKLSASGAAPIELPDLSPKLQQDPTGFVPNPETQLPDSVSRAEQGNSGGIEFDKGLTRQVDSLLDGWQSGDFAKEFQLPLPAALEPTPALPRQAAPEPLSQADASAQQAGGPSIPQITAANVQAWLQKLRETPIPRVGDGRPIPEPFRLRVAETRRDIALAQGGTAETEQAVDAALYWLAQNQSSDGRWDVDRLAGGRETKVLGHDRQGAGSEADTGITGLALLAFLSAGNTHLEGEYQETVLKGLQFLVKSQAADGSLSGNARLYARMYCHGMALLALSEAYGMTGDVRLKEAVEGGLRYTIDSQHQAGGGWRYQPGDQGDLSQFGWQVMAIKSCDLAGLEIPDTTRMGMERFLKSCLSGTHGGLGSYRPNDKVSPAMTAEATICKVFMNQQIPLAARNEAQTEILSGLRQTFEQPSSDQSRVQSPSVSNVPSQNLLRNSNWRRIDEAEATVAPELNLYLMYYGTLAMFATGGEDWETWNHQMQAILLRSPHREGELAGSWAPDTVWGSYGGRVYSTAMAALCLEVYYRYLPLYQLDESAPTRTAQPTVLIRPRTR